MHDLLDDKFAREREKEEYKREIELEKKKQKKHSMSKDRYFKARSKTRRYQNKELHESEFAICSSSFSQPRRFTMQYRGSLSPGWIRSREMDSPGRTLSFVLTFSEGTIHDRPTYRQWIYDTFGCPPPLPLYKNRRAEIVVGDIFI